MDVISEFLTNSASRSRGGKIDLHSLLQSLGSLVSRQRQSGPISLGYVRSILLRSNKMFTESEIDLHCALILESSLQYILDPTDHVIRLVVRSDIMANEIEFLNAILRILHSKSSELRSCPQVLLDFKKSVSIYCASKFASSSRHEPQPPHDQQLHQRLPRQTTVSRGSSISEQGSRPSSLGDRIGIRSSSSSAAASAINSLVRSTDKRYARAVAPAPVITTTVNGRGSSTTQSEKPARLSQSHQNHQKTSQETLPYFRTWVELQDSVVRFLAQVRKQGMDIIFPKTSHDKVLAAIYVAVQMAANPAHRELIDMVMALKDNNVVPGLDALSKTKIRGVLALLKHGKLLDAMGTEGQPVQLALAANITNFLELRRGHDKYLDEFSDEYQVEMSTELWGEIVWYERSEAKNVEYLNAMSKFIEELKIFYSTYVLPTRLEEDNNGIQDKGIDTKFAKPAADDLSQMRYPRGDDKRISPSNVQSRPSRNHDASSVPHVLQGNHVRYPSALKDVYHINNVGVPMHPSSDLQQVDHGFRYPIAGMRTPGMPQEMFVDNISSQSTGAFTSSSANTREEPHLTPTSFRNCLSGTVTFPTTVQCHLDNFPAIQSVQSGHSPHILRHNVSNDTQDSAQTDTDSSSPNTEISNLNLWTSSEVVSPDYFKSLAANPSIANMKICSPRKLQYGLAATSNVEFTSLFDEVSPISIAEHPYQVSVAPIRFSFTQEDGLGEKSKTLQWNGLFNRQTSSMSVSQGEGITNGDCDCANQIMDAYFTHGHPSDCSSTSTFIPGDSGAMNINFKRSASLSIDVNDLHLSDSSTMHLYWRDAEGHIDNNSSRSDITGFLSGVAGAISCTFGNSTDICDGSSELFSPQQGANARFMVDDILNSIASPIKKAKILKDRF